MIHKFLMWSFVKPEFLGLMYWRGLGVEKSIENALTCLKGAAAKGNNYARGYLAELYYKLKLFTECALSGKTVYDMYKTDDQQFMSETEQEGLAIATFMLGRCLMVSFRIADFFPSITERLL